MHTRLRVIGAAMVLGALGALLAAISTSSPAGAATEPNAAWTVSNNTKNHSSSPTVADLDSNGVDDIVIGAQDGWVRAYRDGSSQLMWQAPIIPWGANTPVAIDSTPTVADLDGDGAAEVIVAAGSNYVGEVGKQQGGLVVLNGSTGVVRWQWSGNTDWGDPYGGGTIGGDGYLEGVVSTPAVGDVDGDGHPDIVFGGFDQYIHALDRFGNEVPGFPVFANDTVWSSPALYDVDNDGRLEIFIGTDVYAGAYLDTNIPPQLTPGTFRALDWRDGGVHNLWSSQKLSCETMMSSPAIGDIDGDGRMEVVIGTGNYWASVGGGVCGGWSEVASRSIYAFHLDDGSALGGQWGADGALYLGHGFINASPAIGDVNGDGVAEVVIGDSDGWVYAIAGNGSMLWGVKPAPTGFQIQLGNAPVIADLDGSGTNEVAISTGYATYVLEGGNGGTEQVLERLQSAETTPALGYFGARGWQLIVSSYNTVYGTNRLSAYAMPAPASTVPWAQWRKSANHVGAPPSGGDPLSPQYCRRPTNPAASPSATSGRGYWLLGRDGSIYSFDAPYYGGLSSVGVQSNAIGLAATPSGNGYWILGADGGVFSFGDAAFYGSMGGQRLNAPIVSMAATPTGQGYWLLASDGGVFSFGDAAFYGSTGGMRLNAPVIAMAATSSSRGYWLLASDGGIFSFGDASFYGSTGGMRLNAPVVAMGTDPGGRGYWLLGGDGGVFSFGVAYYGSIPGTGLCGYPGGVKLRAAADGQGYWVAATDGGIFSFGSAVFHGSYPALSGANAAVDMAVRR